MRALLREYVTRHGGSVHDLEEILACRFADAAAARHCAQRLADVCTLLQVECEVADEWVWLFLPPAPGEATPVPRGPRAATRPSPEPAGTVATASSAAATAPTGNRHDRIREPRRRSAAVSEATGSGTGRDGAEPPAARSAETANESFDPRRVRSERLFYLYDPAKGRTDWMFDSREGLHGPFPSKAVAERAIADFVRSCRAHNTTQNRPRGKGSRGSPPPSSRR
jgi:hypothetical protein